MAVNWLRAAVGAAHAAGAVLTESTLALLAGAGGILIAGWGVTAPAIAPTDLPRLDEVTVDLSASYCAAARRWPA